MFMSALKFREHRSRFHGNSMLVLPSNALQHLCHLDGTERGSMKPDGRRRCARGLFFSILRSELGRQWELTHRDSCTCVSGFQGSLALCILNMPLNLEFLEGSCRMVLWVPRYLLLWLWQMPQNSVCPHIVSVLAFPGPSLPGKDMNLAKWECHWYSRMSAVDLTEAEVVGEC